MANSSTTPVDRVRIFSRTGAALAEFRTSVERSWASDNEGRALFNYPSRKTDVVNERNLQFGNWLLVENSALPAWIGVIDTPRYWTARQVAVHAYSPEHVFNWRRGPLEEKITGSAGTLFLKLLSKLNEVEPTIIQPGIIWNGSASREETLNPTPLSENLKRIKNRSGENYTFRVSFDTNRALIVYADWIQNQGNQTNALLQEGKEGGNVEAVANILVEDRDIFNDILAYGDGLTWLSKPNINIRENNSIGKYGLRQISIEYGGVTNTSTLTTNASQKLLETKQPERTFHIFALNIGDTFQYIKLGNVLKLRFQNAGFTSGGLGFETYVKIVGMSYNPAATKNKIELTVREVIYV
jgi:hypothetical protein